MKLLLSIYALLVMTTRPSAAESTGTASGTLEAGGKKIALTSSVALLHDNAEGLLGKGKELRILVTDTAVAPGTMAGIVFLPIEEMAKEGKVQGLMFRLDPAKPNDVKVTLLMKPEMAGQSLLTQTLSVTGKKLFSEWKLANGVVSGAITHKDEGSLELTEGHGLSYTVSFHTAISPAPTVTADLKGADATKSLQVRVLAAKAAALTNGDWAAVRKLSTKQANKHMDVGLAQMGKEAKSFAKQAGAEMKKMLPRAKRVVVRGDTAVVIFGPNEWSTLVKEGGIWKNGD